MENDTYLEPMRVSITSWKDPCVVIRYTVSHNCECAISIICNLDLGKYWFERVDKPKKMCYQSSYPLIWDNGLYPEVCQNLQGSIIKFGRWDATFPNPFSYVINIIPHQKQHSDPGHCTFDFLLVFCSTLSGFLLSLKKAISSSVKAPSRTRRQERTRNCPFMLRGQILQKSKK